MEKKAISIGTEDFKTIIDKNGYLVDKTQMIQSLLDSTAMVTLFTRPRRFGKTLNMSMLRRFFEDERTADGTPVDNRYLFEGLAISKCGEKYLSHQQKYPVISLSLKSGKQPNYELAYDQLRKAVISEFERHAYVLSKGELNQAEQENFKAILSRKEDPRLYIDGLKTLSSCLAKYHGKKCIILIDEYDVPLENAWVQKFYDEMIGFIRSLFESALKTNDSLEFGVITGCLRISRESIFTGLNNLYVNTVLEPEFDDSFGFTDSEVEKMVSYYGLQEKMEEIREWYDGYLFGDKEIYNPWSILNYVKKAAYASGTFPRPYWSNTSSNSIVRELIENADPETRKEIEDLIAGQTLEKPIHEEITYADVHKSRDNLWNFLYFTGYLTSAGQEFRNKKLYVKMVIPNEEVCSIYENTVLSWFDEEIEKTDLGPLQEAILAGDCEKIGNIISDQLMGTISFFDYGENYYHGFLAGLLKAASNYQILSNRESGEGRTDIIMQEPKFRGKAVIIEIKLAKTFGEMEDKCREALSQIEEKKYEEGLRQEGCSEVLKYGVCFFKKGCIVMK